jgi:1-deoxy-D-xylulose-5-phosphate synthase
MPTGERITGTSRDAGALLVGPRSMDASYTEAFGKAVLEEAGVDKRIVAVTAAMPGPTGLLPFEARFPDRFIDVGIAEAHAMTAAAGMAMAGLRPVVAVYSTFLSRCFDQENLDVGLHGAPVVICADRAGITGDDGASHHGVLDMVLALAVAPMAVFAPSEPSEIGPMLHAALQLDGPALIRYPKTPCSDHLGEPGHGLHARILRPGDGRVVIVGVGKMAARALQAATQLVADGVDVTVIDPRVVRPLDPQVVEACAAAELVVTAEDGLVHGGAGHYLASQVELISRRNGVRGPLMRHLGVPTEYITHAKPDTILARLGLDAQGIALAVNESIARLGGPVSPRAASTAAGAGTGAASVSAAGVGTVGTSSAVGSGRSRVAR